MQAKEVHRCDDHLVAYTPVEGSARYISHLVGNSVLSKYLILCVRVFAGWCAGLAVVARSGYGVLGDP